MGYWDTMLAQTFFEPAKKTLIEIASFFALAMILRVRNQIMEAKSQGDALEPLLRFPAFSSDLEASQLAVQASRLQVLRDGPLQTTSYGPTQYRLGARLGYIVSELERELVLPAGEKDENRIMQLLAMSKQIHDVLLGRLSEEDCVWG